MQILSSSFDDDTATLHIKSSCQAEFLVTNAGHARLLAGRISHGGRLSPEQCGWLDQYRCQPVATNRLRLISKLKLLRTELRR